MKIIAVALKDLHNEELFEFSTDFKGKVEYYGKDKLDIKDLFNQFVSLYEKMDESLETLQKSFYTKELEEADRKRDKLFRGLFNVVKASQMQPDVAKGKAAERLFILLGRHKDLILSGNHAKESAAIYNLLQDLRGKVYAPDVTLLALADWVTAIDQAEKEFLSFRAERTEESVAKPKEAMKQIRQQIYPYYNAMIDVMSARLLADGLGGDVVVDPKDLDKEGHFEEDEDHHLHGNITYNFVIDWNETLKKYHTLLAQRAGRRNSKDKPEDPES
jgi:hypothetical protein